MKKIRIFLLALFLVLTFSFVSVKVVNAAGAASSNYNETATDAEKVAYDKERIQLPTTMITSFPVTVDSIYKSEITWETSDATVLDTQYVEESGWVELKRDPVEKKEAKLIVTIKNGTVTDTKEFTISVPGGTTIVNDVTVTYSVGEGLTAPTPTTVKIGKAESLPQAPAKEGYEFAGWYGNLEFTGRRYTTTLGLIKDVTLYAKYDKVSVSKITVSKAPNKTAYTALETFDPTGLELNVEYNYGEPKTITSGFTVEPTILHGDTTEVVVSYGGCTTTIKVTVTPIKMTGVELVRGEVTYDGKEHNLTVTGQVPEWLKVTYSAPVTDANEEGYTVTATFSLAEGYDNSHNDYEIPESLTATLIVNKATYDMNNVTFGNLTATYDGNSHDITVEGYPEGVVPSFAYEGGNINAGSHVVTISFKGDKNYNEIADMTTTLVIEQAEPIVNVKLGKNSPYYVGEKAPDIKLGEGSTNGTIAWNQPYTFVEGENIFSWTFTSSDSNYKNSTGTITLTATSAKVSSIAVTTNPNKTTYTAFEVFDKTGMVVTATKEDGNTFDLTTDDFTVSYVNGSDSFRAGETKVTISYAGVSVDLEGLTVGKATYDMSQVVYEGLTGAIYNGQAHEVTVDNLPTGVTATVSYPNGNITAGTHEVTINFTIADPTNYNEIQGVTKELEIAKGTHDVSGITIEGQTFTYDGTAHSLEVIGTLPEGVTVSYENNGQINAGEYTVTVRFVVADTENYNEIKTSLTATLTILAKSIADVTVEEIANITVNAREFEAQTPTLVVKDGTTLLVLTTDYTVAYANNTAISEGISVTATATITGTGNYQGTKEVTFVIELSEQFKLDEDVTEFEKMSTVDTDVVDTLPLVLSNGSEVKYTALPTAIKLDADGKITVTKTTEVQSYTITVTIQNGETVKYVEMTIKISAKPKSFTTDGVTVSEVTSEIENVTIEKVVDEDLNTGNYVIEGQNVKAAYNFVLTDASGNEVHNLTKAVKVSIPLPTGLDFENISVYHIADDKTATLIEKSEITLVNGNVEFYASAFSAYVITIEEQADSSIIEFAKAGKDESGALANGTEVLGQITSGSDLIKSISTATKLYQGANGLKFGSSKEKGVLKMTLSKNVAGVILTIEKWSTDNATITVNGKTATSGTKVIFDSATNEIKITTVNASKSRFYLVSIELILDGSTTEKTDAEKLEEAKNALSFDFTECTKDFELPTTGLNGSTITWASNSEFIVISSAVAMVKRPSVGEQDATVTLTATLIINSETTTKTFEIIVKAEEESQGGDEPTPSTGSYTLVTDASSLKAGDIIVIASNAQGVTTGNLTDSYLNIVTTTFSNDKNSIEKLAAGTLIFTLGGSEGAWTLTTKDGKKLGATANKIVVLDGGVTTWIISIGTNGAATIQNSTSSYGRILHNVNSKRFTTYTSDINASMLLPQIYRFVSNTQEENTDFVFEDGYVYFGEYPQTLKANDVTITSDTPDADGYYLGSDGARYAKVEAKPYSGKTMYFDNKQEIVSSTTYYFKVEPIKWKILKQNETQYSLMTDLIIDNQVFYSSTSDRTIEEKTIYPNDYEHSDIRKWLNETFYNKAFRSALQSYINETVVDNTLASTGYTSNEYLCNDTNDKVYLLSYQDILNKENGFSTSPTSDTARQKQITDYAKALGCMMDTSDDYYNKGYFWLRTPNNGSNGSNFVRCVQNDGIVNGGWVRVNDYYAPGTRVDSNQIGVAPAITVTITK